MSLKKKMLLIIYFWGCILAGMIGATLIRGDNFDLSIVLIESIISTALSVFLFWIALWLFPGLKAKFIQINDNKAG
jgi:hypothetical protein